MAVITTLSVNMVARTSSFDKGIKRSQKNMRSFQTTAQRTAKVMSGLFTGLIAYVGVRALTSFTKNTMSAIDATAKLSDRINIATEDIIGMRHAAEITGVSVEGMDKSLEMMVRRLGEVRQGTGEAKRALELLGLNVNKLVTLSPAMAFRQIADEINLMSNQADKAAAAYQLFGRQGIKLLNTLKLGSAGLAEMQLEAEKLGITFNRLDAAKVEEANDAITRTKAAFRGLGQELIITLAPGIEKVSKKLTKLITDYRTFRAGIKEIMGKGFVGPPEPAGLTQQLEDQAAAAAASAEAYAKAADKVAKFNDGLEDQIRLFGATANEKAIDQLSKLGETMTGIQKHNFERFIDQAERLAQRLEKVGQANRQIETTAKNLASMKNIAQQLADGLKTSQQRLDEFGQLLEKIVRRGLLTIPQQLELIRRKRDELFNVSSIKNFANGIKESLKSPLQLLKDFRSQLKEAQREGFLSADQVDKALRKKARDLLPAGQDIQDRPKGESQEIRTAFVNVAALASIGQSPQVKEQQRTTEELVKQTQVLRDMSANFIR